MSKSSCTDRVRDVYPTKLDRYTIYYRSTRSYIWSIYDRFSTAYLLDRYSNVFDMWVGSPSHADQGRPFRPHPITHADRARPVPDRLIELIWSAVRKQHKKFNKSGTHNQHRILRVHLMMMIIDVSTLTSLHTGYHILEILENIRKKNKKDLDISLKKLAREFLKLSLGYIAIYLYHMQYG
jgi:hypothetical protein